MHFYCLNFPQMNTMQQPIAATPYHAKTSVFTFQRLFAWCREQEKNRLLWLAAMITAHGCVITPITALLVTLSGNNIILWAFVIASMGMTLIVNLAALPTKITIPVFFLSILIDLAVIGYCIAMIISIS